MNPVPATVPNAAGLTYQCPAGPGRVSSPVRLERSIPPLMQLLNSICGMSSIRQERPRGIYLGAPGRAALFDGGQKCFRLLFSSSSTNSTVYNIINKY
jgi:hypothetical protein